MPASTGKWRAGMQSQGYNVTSTNLMPQTFTMLQASGAQALVLDLATGESSLWDLVDQLVGDAATRALPVVVTSPDEQLLAAAQTRPWSTTGRFTCSSPSSPPCSVPRDARRSRLANVRRSFPRLLSVLRIGDALSIVQQVGHRTPAPAQTTRQALLHHHVVPVYELKPRRKIVTPGEVRQRTLATAPLEKRWPGERQVVGRASLQDVTRDTRQY